MLTLYHTDGCHLCELAEALLAPAADRAGLAWQKQDIAADDQLIERYGIRIPVIRNEVDGAEIGWPFDADGLQEWLER